MRLSANSIAIQRLVALGRSHGAITAQDLKSVLPIEDMTEDQLVGVISLLEDAGVPVEIDAPGSARSRWPEQLLAQTAEGSSSSQPSRVTAVHASHAIEPVPVTRPVEPDRQPDRQAGVAVLLAAVMSCCVFLLAGWVWHW